MRIGLFTTFAALSLVLSPSAAQAAGFAGTFVPDTLSALASRVFVSYPSASNPDGCGAATSLAVDMASTAEADRAMAIILTAIATNRTVTFWVDGCAMSSGGVTVPKVTSVTLNK